MQMSSKHRNEHTENTPGWSSYVNDYKKYI